MMFPQLNIPVKGKKTVSGERGAQHGRRPNLNRPPFRGTGGTTLDTEKRLRLQLRLHDGRLAYAIALVQLHHPGGRS